MTTRYDIARIAEGLYEIGEFDCDSMFLIVGEERALLIDAGIGLGDLRCAIAELTDKPVDLALTHNHLDHVCHAPLFGQAYIHPLDNGASAAPAPSAENRRNYINFIAKRSGKTYPYSLDEDLYEGDFSTVKLLPLEDQQVFDLGNRRVTAYLCSGHTEGSCVFLDEKSRTLLLGDAVNCNLLYGKKVPVERALSFLQRLEDMKDRYDRYFNGHYDFRPFGEPLGADVLPDAIAACSALVSGDYEPQKAPSMFPGGPDRWVITKGRTMITYDPEYIKNN